MNARLDLLAWPAHAGSTFHASLLCCARYVPAAPNGAVAAPSPTRDPAEPTWAAIGRALAARCVAAGRVLARNAGAVSGAVWRGGAYARL